MKEWEYIIVQAYTEEYREDIGSVSVFIGERRPTSIDELLSLIDSWKSDGYSVSCAGKIKGEDGEVLVDPSTLKP